MDSVIFGSPLFVLLYGAALLLCIFDIVKRASGYVLSLISAAIFAGTTVYAFVSGAGYEEVGIVTLVFLALNVGGALRSRGNQK